MKESGTAKGIVPFRESAITMLLKDSLSSAKSKASLVVNIAEDPEMIKESVSSLRFGITCGGEMKCKAEAAATYDAGDVKEIQDQQKSIQKQLSEMEAYGMSGTLNPAFPH